MSNENLKDRYPNSSLVKAGLPPIADIDPWLHRETPINEERLKRMGDDLEDPMAASEGHKKTLLGCRELHDEVIRLQKDRDALCQYIAKDSWLREGWRELSDLLKSKISGWI